MTDQNNTPTSAPRPPKSFGWRAFGMMLGVQAILLLLAWTYGSGKLNISIPYGEGDTLRFKYASLENVFDFSPPGSEKADSLLEKKLANLDNMEKFIQTGESESNDFDPMAGDFPEFKHPEVNGGKALDPFFEQLAALEDGEELHTRVAHYGDSQIEGDRISMFIRNTLQKRFGGGGIGYVQLFEPTNHQHLSYEHSDNWVRNEVFQNKAEDAFYGMGGVVFTYGPHDEQDAEADSEDEAAETPDANAAPVKNDTTAAKNAEAPAAEGEPDAYATLKVSGAWFNRLRLAWGKATAPVRVVLEVDDEPVDEQLLEGDMAFSLTSFKVPNGAKHLRFKFYGPSPKIYGALLDTHTGVQVDNFGIRGHGGNGLLRINLPSFKAQAKALNTKLIILQFGGNAVPSEDVEDWSFYETSTYNIIHRIKRAYPRAGIIVMSVSDAAHKVDGKMQSYATVPHIRIMQQRAAERANVAFFDLYEAMGGPGSIISWVGHDPPYAAKDFAHFSYAGQKLVANMLMTHLIREYEQYLKRREQNAEQIAGPQANSAGQ